MASVIASGKTPVFLSAPRMYLKISQVNDAGKTEFVRVAYAIGLNLDVSVDLRPVRVCGNFEVINYEPVMYNVVRGSMQIYKLLAKKGTQITVTKEQQAADGKTNSIKEYVNLSDHLDVKNVLLSRTFDIEIKVDFQSEKGKPKQSMTLGTIRDIRLTGRSLNFSMNQLLSETVTFEGLLFAPGFENSEAGKYGSKEFDTDVGPKEAAK